MNSYTRRPGSHYYTLASVSSREDPGQFIPGSAVHASSELEDDAGKSQDMDRRETQSIQLYPGLERIFHEDDKHIWLPLFGWGGFILAGSLCSRFTGIRLRSIAKFSAVLGPSTFLSCRLHRTVENVNHDPALAVIWTVALAFQEVDRSAFLEAWSPSPNVHSHFDMASPRFSEDMRFTQWLWKQVKWRTDHTWSSSATRASIRAMLQHDLETSNLSPHDIDVCVTYLANSIDSPRWFHVAQGSIVTGLAALSLKYFVRPTPWRTRLLSFTTVSSWGIWMITDCLRGYQHMAYPERIQDKHGVVMALGRKFQTMTSLTSR
ncbi:hypothetical protein AcV5_003936 [Taiwanofungus camphoratus]|nr:hypothetical protein AcV5_003936 [Antrodia cinnamomea]